MMQEKEKKKKKKKKWKISRRARAQKKYNNIVSWGDYIK